MFCKNHGFVSPFSLQERSEQVIISSHIVLESWPRGRRCSPAKRVYAKSVSGVRIPSSPPPNISRGLNVLAVQTSFSLIFRLSKFPNFPRFSCNFCNFFGHYAIKCNQISCFWQTNNYQIYLRSKRQIRHLSSRYICHIFSLRALLCLQIASFATFLACVYKINLKTILKFTNL